MKKKLYLFERWAFAVLLFALFASSCLFLYGRAFISAIGDFY